MKLMYERILLKHKVASLISKGKLGIDSHDLEAAKAIEDEYNEIYSLQEINDVLQIIYFENHERINIKNNDDECSF